MRLKNDREFHCWNVFFTFRIAESCRSCQARKPRIYSSGFDEQREKSNGGKNGQRASKCDLYRPNRSQTASVRTFKNDLMWPGLACTGATEERVRGEVAEEGNLLHVGDTRRPCTKLKPGASPSLASSSCVYPT